MILFVKLYVDAMNQSKEVVVGLLALILLLVGYRVFSTVRVYRLGQKLNRLARIFHTFVGALINTAALARCKDALSLGELFQQFVARSKKPLKRLVGRCSRSHRAKAPVLMRRACRFQAVRLSSPHASRITHHLP